MDSSHLIKLAMMSLVLLLSSCDPDGSGGEGMETVDLTDIAYDPVTYEVDRVVGFPILEFPADNPLTEDGVQLGRRLFYDPVLSRDSTLSCASCHLQEGSFTDNLAFSPGVDGAVGERSSMSLVDVGFHLNGLFWDGRVATLEEQALLPVEDPVELDHDWAVVVRDLRADSIYQVMFRKAFGISDTDGINRELAAMAIAQFERSLLSTGSSTWDRVKAGRAIFSDQEDLGRLIFFDRGALEGRPELPDGQCFHCHIDPLFTDNLYRNNGLDVAPDYEDFPDLGRGGAIGERLQNGQFRTPTLRNVEFTAPYMHDGRFETLEEVMEHYISGGLPSVNKDPLMDSINLNTEQRDAVIAFLKTLSDRSLLDDPRYAQPE